MAEKEELYAVFKFTLNHQKPSLRLRPLGVMSATKAGIYTLAKGKWGVEPSQLFIVTWDSFLESLRVSLENFLKALVPDNELRQQAVREAVERKGERLFLDLCLMAKDAINPSSSGPTKLME